MASAHKIGGLVTVRAVVGRDGASILGDWVRLFCWECCSKYPERDHFFAIGKNLYCDKCIAKHFITEEPAHDR